MSKPLKNVIYEYLKMVDYYSHKEIEDYQLRKISKAANSKNDAFYACELFVKKNYSINQLTRMLRNSDKLHIESVADAYNRLFENDKYSEFEEKIENINADFITESKNEEDDF